MTPKSPPPGRLRRPFGAIGIVGWPCQFTVRHREVRTSQGGMIASPLPPLGDPRWTPIDLRTSGGTSPSGKRSAEGQRARPGTASKDQGTIPARHGESGEARRVETDATASEAPLRPVDRRWREGLTQGNQFAHFGSKTGHEPQSFANPEKNPVRIHQELSIRSVSLFLQRTDRRSKAVTSRIARTPSIGSCSSSCR